MNVESMHPDRVSQGVDELIAKLRQEGVDAGNAEAEKVLNAARQKAKEIMADAEKQSMHKINEAQKKANAFLNGGQEALKTAMRDMVLTLKTELTEVFRTDVKRLVQRELKKPELLKALILEIAGKLSVDANIDKDSKLEFMLPENVVDLNDLRSSPEQIENSPLTEFVFGLTRDMLIEGVNFKTSNDVKGGMSVKLEDRDLVLDFTEQAVASMLLEHLQPRFRAILEGVVR
jgi:V/A-type H+-transporting ATPase subunit E